MKKKNHNSVTRQNVSKITCTAGNTKCYMTKKYGEEEKNTHTPLHGVRDTPTERHRSNGHTSKCGVIPKVGVQQQVSELLNIKTTQHLAQISLPRRAIVTRIAPSPEGSWYYVMLECTEKWCCKHSITNTPRPPPPLPPQEQKKKILQKTKMAFRRFRVYLRLY